MNYNLERRKNGKQLNGSEIGQQNKGKHLFQRITEVKTRPCVILKHKYQEETIPKNRNVTQQKKNIQRAYSIVMLNREKMQILHRYVYKIPFFQTVTL